MAQISVTAPADTTEAGDDGRTTALTFSVTFDELPPDSTTVAYTVTINGVAGASQELVLGTLDGEITVEVPNDAVDNGNDTVAVTLTEVTAGESTISGSGGSATATVVDDDTPSAVGTVLYRVNAGGAEVAATDGGPNWGADTGSFGTASTSPYLFSAPTVNTIFTNTSGSSYAGNVTTTTGFVPASTPLSVFDTERGDRGDTAPTLAYQFDVGTDYGLVEGDEVEIRLYFAEIFSGVDSTGQRVFDVSVDGTTPTAFDDIDAIAAAGPNAGFMRSYVATVDADGLLDIEFLNGIENPAVKAIEIIARNPADPIPAEISIAAPDPATVEEAGNEGNTTLEFAVSFDKTPDEPITVQYDVDINGVVSTGLTQVIGSADGVISVNVPNDDVPNGNETVTVTLTGVTVGGTAAVLGTAVSAIGTVTEDDAAPLPPGTAIFRINSGGVEVAATDGGIAWSADTNVSPTPFLVAGGPNIFTSTATIDATTVGSVPAAIFDTERWDPASGDEMQYEFAVNPGFYTVNLYMVEGSTGQTGVGSRVVDVAVEGSVPEVFNDIDPSAISQSLYGTGNFNSAFVLSHTLQVVDGTLDLDFLHDIVENPAIRGIEILTAEEITPVVSIGDAGTVVENGDVGNTTLTFPVTFNTLPVGNVTVGYDVVINGGAPTSLTAVIAPTGGDITVDILNDELDNLDDAVTVTLTGIVAGDAELGAQTSGTGTVTEDDVQLLVGFGPDNDLDSDGIANKDDADVDGDTVDNNAETFSYDGTNAGTALTAGETILLGFDTDGTPFENGLTGALDSSNAATTEIDLNAAAVAGGTLNILASGGDAFRALNTQQNALVAGYSAEYGMRVETRFAAPDWDAITGGVQAPVNFQSAGVVIGLDQDNYIKAVFGRTAQAFEFGTEIGGTANNTATDTIASNDYSAIFEIVIAIETFIDNSSGTPVAKAQAFGTLIGSDNNPLTGSDAVMLGAAKTLSGSLADAVLNGTVLGAGVVQTANGTQPTFNVSYEYLEVTASSMPVNEAPTVAAPIVDQTPLEDALYSFDIPPGTFADDMGEGALALTATLDDDNPLPVWLNFEPLTGTFSGTPLQADVDLGAITVKVTATDGSGETVTDEFTLTPQNVNDAPLGTVTITGVASQGEILTASNDLTDADGLGTITYQWRADGADIVGATGDTFTPTQAEVGAEITVVASYTDDGGTVESVPSAATAVVTNTNDAPVGTVTISGVASQGEILTASNDLTDADGLGTITYQWRADGADIVGATGENFTLTQAEVGAEITVVASYTDGGGAAETVASVSTAAVANINDAPTITGTLAPVTTTRGLATSVDLSALELDDPDETTPTLVAEIQGGGELPAGITLVDTSLEVAAGTAEGAYVIDIFANDTQVNSATPVSVTLTVGPPLPGTIVGTPDSETLIGTTGDDTILGLEGDDFVFSGGGDDTLIDGAGSDFYDGGDDQDTLVLSAALADFFSFQNLDGTLALSRGSDRETVDATVESLQFTDGTVDFVTAFATATATVNLTDLYGGSMSTALSSEFASVYGGTNLLDNNTGNFASTQNGGDEWIELDFGDDLEITSVVLTNRNVVGDRLDGAVVSLRDKFGDTVFTFNSIEGATNGEVFELVLPTATTARSLYIDGADAQYLHLAEIDLIGLQPADYNPPLNLTDLYGESMSVALSSEFAGVYGGANLLDNNTGNFASTQNGGDEWIELDFGDDLEITSVVLTNRNVVGDRLDGAVVSLRDALGVTVYTFEAIAGATNGEVFELVLPTATTARSLYIDGADAQYLHLAEIDLIGLQPADYNPPSNLTDLYGDSMSVEMSSTFSSVYGPDKLLDNNTGNFAVTKDGVDEFISLNFGQNLEITSVVLTNRSVEGARLNGAVVTLLDEGGDEVDTWTISGATNGQEITLDLASAMTARSLYIDGVENEYLQLAEIDLFGLDPLAIV